MADSLIRLRQLSRGEVSGYVEEIISGYLSANSVDLLYSGTGILSGVFYPLYENPSGYLTGVPVGYVMSSQTGIFLDDSDLVNYNAAIMAQLVSLYYPLTGNPANYLLATQTGDFVGDSETGVFSTYQQLTGVSGYLIGQLTGVSGYFDGQLANISGYLTGLIETAVGVSSLNGASGAVNIYGAGNVIVSTAGSDITISGSGGGTVDNTGILVGKNESGAFAAKALTVERTGIQYITGAKYFSETLQAPGIFQFDSPNEKGISLENTSMYGEGASYNLNWGTRNLYGSAWTFEYTPNVAGVNILTTGNTGILVGINQTGMFAGDNETGLWLVGRNMTGILVGKNQTGILVGKNQTGILVGKNQTGSFVSVNNTGNFLTYLADTVWPPVFEVSEEIGYGNWRAGDQLNYWAYAYHTSVDGQRLYSRPVYKQLTISTDFYYGVLTIGVPFNAEGVRVVINAIGITPITGGSDFVDGSFYDDGNVGGNIIWNAALTGYEPSSPKLITGYIVYTGQTGILVGENETGIFADVNHTHANTGDFALASLTGNFVTTAQTGVYVGENETGNFVGKNLTGTFADTNHTHPNTGDLASQSYVTGVSGYLISQIQAASAGVSSINSTSGILTLAGAGNVSVTTNAQTITVSGNTGNFVGTNQTGIYSSTFLPIVTTVSELPVKVDWHVSGNYRYQVKSGDGFFQVKKGDWPVIDVGALEPVYLNGYYDSTTGAASSWINLSTPEIRKFNLVDCTLDNTGNFVTTAQTGIYVGENETGDFVGKNQTGNFLTTVSLSNLTDVTLTTPTVDQSLVYNGSTWINKSIGSVSAGQASVYYLNAAPSTGGNSTLLRSPTGLAESSDIAVANNGLSNVIERFISPPLGGTQIDGGLWTFNTYAHVSSAAGTSTIVQRINKRVIQTGTFMATGAGLSRTGYASWNAFVSGDATSDITQATLVETPNSTFWITGYISPTTVAMRATSTGDINESGSNWAMYRFLFKATTPEINTTSSGNLIETRTVQPTFTGINPTDRLVAAYFAQTTNVGNITFTLYHDGTTQASNIVTPIITRHNDLAGLQGGTSDQYYHLTSGEYAALSTYVTTGQTGVYVGENETGNFVGKNMTGTFADVNHVHANTGNFVLTSQTGNFVTTSQTGMYVGENETGNFVSTIAIGEVAFNLPFSSLGFSELNGGAIIKDQANSFGLYISSGIRKLYDTGANETIDFHSKIFKRDAWSFEYAPTLSGEVFLTGAAGFVTTGQTGYFISTTTFGQASISVPFYVYNTSELNGGVIIRDTSSWDGLNISNGTRKLYNALSEETIDFDTLVFKRNAWSFEYPPTLSGETFLTGAAGFVSVSQTGNFVTTAQTGVYVGENETGNFASIPYVTGISGYLQGQIGGAGVNNLNGLAGSVIITGIGVINTSINGQTINISGSGIALKSETGNFITSSDTGILVGKDETGILVGKDETGNLGGQWISVDNGIHYSAANVGINQAEPNYSLDVNGDINLTSTHYFNGGNANGGELQIAKGGNYYTFSMGQDGIWGVGNSTQMALGNGLNGDGSNPGMSFYDYSNGGTLQVGGSLGFGQYNGGTFRANVVGVGLWGGNANSIVMAAGTTGIRITAIDAGATVTIIGGLTVSTTGNFTNGLYVSGNSVVTGSTSSFVTTGQTGVFADVNHVHANTGNFVLTSQTGVYVGENETGNFVGKNMTGIFADANHTHSNTGDFVTTAQTGNFLSNTNFVFSKGISLMSTGGLAGTYTAPVWRCNAASRLTGIFSYRISGNGATINAYKNNPSLPHLAVNMSSSSTGVWISSGVITNDSYSVGDSLIVQIMNLDGLPAAITVQTDFIRQ
jgi:hypothetical protein